MSNKILVVSEPGVDGVFQHVKHLLDFLCEDEHYEPFYAYSSLRDSDENRQLVEKLRDSGYQAIDLQVGNGPAMGDFSALFKLIKVIFSFKPKIICSHSSKAGVLSRVLFPLTVMMGIKQIYIPHAFYGLGKKGIVAIFYNLIEGVLGRFSKVVVLSEGEREFAVNRLKIPAKRLLSLNNPVDTDRFLPPMSYERDRLRKKFNIPLDAFVVGSIGRISYQKNPEALYRWFKVQSEEETSQKLMLVHIGEGDPASVKSLNELQVSLGIENEVIRLPYSDDPSEFYKTFDLYASFSRYEGLPLTLLEALATNLPVVLSNVVGHTDFLNNEEIASLGIDITDGSDRYAPISLPYIKNTTNTAREYVLAKFSLCNFQKTYNSFFK